MKMNTKSIVNNYMAIEANGVDGVSPVLVEATGMVEIQSI